MDFHNIISVALRVALNNRNETTTHYLSVCSNWGYDSEEAKIARESAMNAISHHLDMMVFNDNKIYILSEENK